RSRRGDRSTLVDKKFPHSLKHFVEFLSGHLSNRMKNDVLFDAKQSLRTDEARLRKLAAFKIAASQRNGESIGVRAAGDLAENQIFSWKISNHQSGPALSAIGSRKRNDNDFAGYRFDHAASSSGEFQSRPRTDSLNSAPLNALFSSELLEASGFISLTASKYGGAECRPALVCRPWLAYGRLSKSSCTRDARAPRNVFAEQPSPRLRLAKDSGRYRTMKSCRTQSCARQVILFSLDSMGWAVAFRLGGASIVSTVESHLPLLKELWLAVDEIVHHDD